MIVSCPSCSAQFSVSDSALGAQGRKVKCSKCAHIWLQSAPDQAPSAAHAASGRGDSAPAAPVDELPPRPRAQRPRARTFDKRGFRGAGAWITLALFVVAIASAYLFRDGIMDALPATQKMYVAVGLGPEPPFAGLDLIDVSWKRGGGSGGEKVLHITGKVVNKSQKIRNVPQLSGILFDGKDGELHKWTFSAPESRLLPGEDVIFETQISNPAPNAARLTIHFKLPPGSR